MNDINVEVSEKEMEFEFDGFKAYAIVIGVVGIFCAGLYTTVGWIYQGIQLLF